MKKKILNFHLIISKTFGVGSPLIISEIQRRGHNLSTFDERSVPPLKKLLSCDVLIDMSTITDKKFYFSLKKALKQRKSLGLNIPLMIDPPDAIVKSFDKLLTHKIFPDLIPESYSLTGKNNIKKIQRCKDDKFIIVKSPEGWWGRGVKRLSPRLAFAKYSKAKNLIIQKYIDPSNGVGRVVTLFNNNDFEIVASYTRISRSWKVGVEKNYVCKHVPITKKLKEFSLLVSRRSGLYLNGIDYIYHQGKYVLLETNAVPAIKEPMDVFGIDIPKKLLNHIERNTHHR